MSEVNVIIYVWEARNAKVKAHGTKRNFREQQMRRKGAGFGSTPNTIFQNEGIEVREVKCGGE